MYETEKPTKGVLLEYMIYQKTRTQNMADVKTLNMWGYELEDISIVSKLINAETISLPINKITSLSAFSTCRSLKNLLLRQNQISDFSELDYLQDLPHLTTLSLSENPISRDPNYRETVIRKLPQLQKLDDIEVSLRGAFKRPSENSNKENLPEQKQHLLRKSENVQGMKKFNIISSIQSREEEQARTPRCAPTPRIHAERNDSNYLTAVLSLIPELSPESMQIVLQAIHDRCSH